MPEFNVQKFEDIKQYQDSLKNWPTIIPGIPVKETKRKPLNQPSESPKRKKQIEPSTSKNSIPTNSIHNIPTVTTLNTADLGRYGTSPIDSTIDNMTTSDFAEFNTRSADFFAPRTPVGQDSEFSQPLEGEILDTTLDFTQPLDGEIVETGSERTLRSRKLSYNY